MLIELAKPSVGIDVWLEYIIDLCFALAIALTAATAIGVPLYQSSKKRSGYNAPAWEPIVDAPAS